VEGKNSASVTRQPASIHKVKKRCEFRMGGCFSLITYLTEIPPVLSAVTGPKIVSLPSVAVS
jgi:hypothetical protein